MYSAGSLKYPLYFLSVLTKGIHYFTSPVPCRLMISRAALFAEISSDVSRNVLYAV